MRPTLIVLLILINTVVFAQKSDAVKTVDAFLLANEHHKVLPYLEGQLKQSPKNEELLRLLGFYNLQKQNLVAAEKYYREALVINPKCARCELNLGNIYALKDDFKTALSHLEKAIQIDSRDANLWMTRGRLKEMLQDGNGALSDYNKAIEMEPENATHYLQRGQYNMHNGYYTLALTDFNKAIAITPTSYLGYYQRSNLYFKQQYDEDALKDVRKAIELDSKQETLFISEGVILNSLQKYEQSLTSYSKAIAINPNYFLAYLNRAKTYYALENLDASCSDLQFAKRLIIESKLNDQTLVTEIENDFNDYCDESKASYYYQRGIANYNLKSYSKAVELYNLGLAKFPNHTLLLAFKGNASLALGENKEALKAYELSLTNKSHLLNELKQSQSLRHSTEAEALKAYNATLSDIYFGMATAEANSKNFTAALTHVNRAIQLKQNQPIVGTESLFNLRGTIYLALANYELAQLDFDKSIAIKKNYSLAYVNRAIAKASLAEKVQIASYSLGHKANNQPLQLVWASMGKSTRKKTEGNLSAALEDCNTAIALDQQMGFAYYIRGQLKQLLGQRDYCIDLLMAKKLGMQMEATLLKNCSN